MVATSSSTSTTVEQNAQDQPSPQAMRTYRDGQIVRRRTFAIVSHPDAGKTTLTEKLLLYGGALNLAGSVTARKNQRATTSDWMELERQRGISVNSTVLQFEYKNFCINLLDTPGHHDFSEDTYRVLTAVDSVVMVIDAAKGIEQQTRKLFEICRQRGIPIFTFINKLDRPSKPLLELLDEIETVLGIHAVPVNWPLGNGNFFKGIYDRESKLVHLFERTVRGAYRAPEKVTNFEDALVKSALPPDIYDQAMEELALLEEIGSTLDTEAVLSGQMTPVFFGSAMTNFGVDLLLNRFIELAPKPVSRLNGDEPVNPTHEAFSGFIFKIQANMNPKHRDRVAFIRVVSGCFERDMHVWNTRNGERIRLSNSQRLIAQERETIDEAWPGDVVGIVGNQDFHMGDTLSTQPDIIFREIPVFPPECFAMLYNTSTAKYKRFRQGLDQLLKEGVARVFQLADSLTQAPLLGAVGPLQFEVLQYRLQTEYGAETRVETASWQSVKWISPGTPVEPGTDRPAIYMPSDTALAQDAENHWVVLAGSTWGLKLLLERNPPETFLDVPPVANPKG